MQSNMDGWELVNSMATSLQPDESDFSIQKRRDFYNFVCGAAPVSPRVDLPRICDAWRIVTGADWVWFWLFNDLTKQWQLLSASPQGDSTIIPKNLSINAKNSVNDYINNAKTPVFVTDLKNWQTSHGDSTYKVAFSNVLLEMGCLAIQAVPLLPPPLINDPAFSPSTTLRMSICAHFRDPQKRIPHSDASLLLLGRAVALAVVNSYLMEQRTTLLELNALAAPYLTNKSNRPLAQRKAYVKALITLLCEKLSVKYASIFYHAHGSETVECFGSTGLYNSLDKKAVPQEKISGVVYRANDGSITWGVVESGKPYVSLTDQACDRLKPRYTELPVHTDELKESWIIYPISEPTVGTNTEVNSLGVIRCVGTSAHFEGKPPCNVDQMQILLLDCISRQIGFVLETLSASVNRERTISTVRHDLLAPVQMIRDTVELMLPDPMPFQEDIPTNLKDLLFSSVTAFHLIPLLDPNPAEIAECSPGPVMLSGDIIARLKAMLTPFARRQSQMTISFGDFSKIPQVKVDAILIERVVYNLVMNAIKYGVRGSEIKIIPTVTPKDGVIIGIMNEGEGILEEEKEEIFEGSYRSPRFEKKLGLGLGLKIARAAMRMQGGDLILSQAANPTIFSILIPRKLII